MEFWFCPTDLSYCYFLVPECICVLNICWNHKSGSLTHRARAKRAGGTKQKPLNSLQQPLTKSYMESSTASLWKCMLWSYRQRLERCTNNDSCQFYLHFSTKWLLTEKLTQNPDSAWKTRLDHHSYDGGTMGSLLKFQIWHLYWKKINTLCRNWYAVTDLADALLSISIN